MKVALSVKVSRDDGDTQRVAQARLDLEGGSAYGQNPLIGLVNATAALLKSTVAEVSK
jgi:hypothetical protein